MTTVELPGGGATRFTGPVAATARQTGDGLTGIFGGGFAEGHNVRIPAANGGHITSESVNRLFRSEWVPTYYRGPLDVDNITGETWAMREAYRSLMLREPAVFAALMSKIDAVAALTPSIIAEDKDNPEEIAVANFVEYAGKKCIGGWPGIITNIATGALLEGWGMCEKVMHVFQTGKYRLMKTIYEVAATDTKFVRLDLDQFKQIRAVRGMKANAGEAMDPSRFIIATNRQIFSSPFGISDLRPAYRDATLIDAAITLRAILLENYSGPFITATYPDKDIALKNVLEQILAEARAQGFAVVPKGCELQVLNLAASADAQFDSAVEAYQKRIYTAIRGAYLPFTEGDSGSKIGNTQVAAGITDLGVWRTALMVSEVINRQLIPDLVIPNFGTSRDFPSLALGGQDSKGIAEQLDIWERTQKLTGSVSKKGVYELAKVKPPQDHADEATGQPAGLGGMGGGMPPGMGGAPPEGGPGGPGGGGQDPAGGGDLGPLTPEGVDPPPGSDEAKYMGGGLSPHPRTGPAGHGPAAKIPYYGRRGGRGYRDGQGHVHYTHNFADPSAAGGYVPAYYTPPYPLSEIEREVYAALKSQGVHVVAAATDEFSWTAAQTKKNTVKAVGVGRDAGRTLYGQPALAALKRGGHEMGHEAGREYESHRDRRAALEQRRGRASELTGKAMAYKATPEEINELVDHLPHLTKKQLSSVNARLMGSFGGDKTIGGRVAKLVEHIRGTVKENNESTEDIRPVAGERKPRPAKSAERKPAADKDKAEGSAEKVTVASPEVPKAAEAAGEPQERPTRLPQRPGHLFDPGVEPDNSKLSKLEDKVIRAGLLQPGETIPAGTPKERSQFIHDVVARNMDEDDNHAPYMPRELVDHHRDHLQRVEADEAETERANDPNKIDFMKYAIRQHPGDMAALDARIAKIKAQAAKEKDPQTRDSWLAGAESLEQKKKEKQQTHEEMKQDLAEIEAGRIPDHWSDLSHDPDRKPDAQAAAMGQTDLGGFADVLQSHGGDMGGLIQKLTAGKPTGQGGNANFYAIPGTDYGIRIEKNAGSLEGRELTPAENPFGDTNVGQAVATYGKGVQVLKLQSGVPAGMPFKHEKTPEGTAAAVATFRQNLAHAASMDDAAYDKLLADMQHVNATGHKMDPSKPGNLLIDADGGRFGLVDIAKKNEGSDYKNTPAELAVMLVNNPNFAKHFGVDEGAKADAKAILGKIEAAAGRAGIPTGVEQSPAAKYAYELAEATPGQTAPEAPQKPAKYDHGKTIRAAKTAVINTLKESSNLSEDRGQEYATAITGVLDVLPPAAAQRLGSLDGRTTFHADNAALAEHLGGLSPKAKAAHAAGRKIGGAYNPKTGELHFDGGLKGQSPAEVHAHEITHAIDGPNHELSNSPEWQDAYEKDIKHGGLSKYAVQSPAEGFAEFGRLVYGRKTAPDSLKAGFPAATAFFAAKGLLPKGGSANPEMPETFEGTPTEENGQHIDHLAATEPAAATKAPWHMTPDELKASGITFFRTGQGSLYAHDPKTGQTIRVKSQHTGHLASDTGLKRGSEQTVYIDPDHAKDIGMWQTSNAGGKRVHLKDGHLQKTSKGADGRIGLDGRSIPYETEPRVGLSPLELNDRSSQVITPGSVAYGGTHPGSPITEENIGHEEGHRAMVEAAVAAGKTVPQHVLDEYPDLAGNYQQQKSAAADGEKPGDLVQNTETQPEAGNERLESDGGGTPAGLPAGAPVGSDAAAEAPNGQPADAGEAASGGDTQAVPGSDGERGDGADAAAGGRRDAAVGSGEPGVGGDGPASVGDGRGTSGSRSPGARSGGKRKPAPVGVGPARNEDGQILGGGLNGQEPALPDPTPQEAVRSDPPTPENPTDLSAGNFQYTSRDFFGKGPKDKFNANIAAIRLKQQLDLEGRPATPEEQAVLSRYVGWGQFPGVFNDWSDWKDTNPDMDYRQIQEERGKWEKEREVLQGLLTDDEWKAARASTKNAHYTHPDIVDLHWQLAEQLGYKGGKFLETSAGIGYYLGMMPKHLTANTKSVAVELDPTTGGMLKHLYPSAHTEVKGFQDHKATDNLYDLVASNVPFGDYGVYDPRYAKHDALIHDYFFLKSADKVKPGGLIMHITSKGTLDKQTPEIRKALAEKLDLVGAIRFPGDSHKANAGTSVVTDMLIFRKRHDHEPAPENPNWLNTTTVPDPAGGEPIPINQYFADNPHMVLGTVDRTGKMRAANQPNVSRTADYESRLKAAIASLPKNVMNVAKPSKAAFKPPEEILTPGHVKPGGFHIENGQVYIRIEDGMVPQTVSKPVMAKIQAHLDLRDKLRALTSAELSGEDSGPARAALNKQYDAFVKEHGFLHKVENRKAFAGDPDAAPLQALENYDKKTKKTTKADIFTQATRAQAKPKERVDTAGEAIAVTLHEHGRLDIEHAAKVLGVTPEEAGRRMVAQGLAYNNPAGDWEIAAVYLSGNVREKLATAVATAAVDPQYHANVAALQRVQPEDIPVSEISCRLGSPWVPPADVHAFATELLGVPDDSIYVGYNPAVGKWEAGFAQSATGTRARKSASAINVHGTEDWHAMDLIYAACNNKDVVVKRTDKETKKEYVDEKATGAARDKKLAIQEKFKEWLWGDEERRDRLHRFYNDNFNNIVETKHDGSHLTFPGKNPLITMREHQANAVQRVITNGTALFGHEVGTGKTYTMIASAMELRRLGLAKKPMIACMKANVETITADARKLYPNAKIISTVDLLGADKRTKKGGDDTETSAEMTAAQRKLVVSRIATGDYDMVIMTHDHMDLLPMHRDFQAKYIENQIEQAVEAIAKVKSSKNAGKADARIVKQIENTISKMEVRLAEHLKAENKDDAVTFEETGIDHVFVDEAQRYKNLQIFTQMGDVKGIATAASDRAHLMKMKCEYLQQQNKGRGVVFATGTPVSNTMGEMYTMQRYLQPDELRKRGLENFDAWANQFGEVTHNTEFTTTGQYKQVSRLAKFTNLPELRQMTGQVIEIVRSDDLKNEDGSPAVPRPNRVDRVITSESSPEQKAHMLSLVERAKDIKRTGVPGADNMLKIGSDGKKASIDMRLVDPEAEFNPDGKVAKLIENVVRISKENPGKTQLIFSDIGVNPIEVGGEDETKVKFHLYKDIIDRLVAGGIPRDKIADFSKLKDDAKEQAMEQLRNGTILVGIGSTEKLGTGVNVQDVLHTMHHLDCPHRPSDIEQRNGRGWRNGNTNKDVHVVSYVTAGSLDQLFWQRISTKAKMIQQGVYSKDSTLREAEEEDDDELSPDHVMASASGDMRVLRQVELKHEVGVLDNSARRHEADQQVMRGKIKRNETTIADKEAEAKTFRDAKSRLDANPDFSINIGGKTFTERTHEQIDAALAKESAKGANDYRYDSTHVGDYRGMQIVRRGSGLYLNVETKGKERLIAIDPYLSNLEGKARQLTGYATRADAEAADLKKDNASLQGQMGKAFPHATKHAAKKEHLRALTEELEGRALPIGYTAGDQVQDRGGQTHILIEPDKDGGIKTKTIDGEDGRIMAKDLPRRDKKFMEEKTAVASGPKVDKDDAGVHDMKGRHLPAIPDGLNRHTHFAATAAAARSMMEQGFAPRPGETDAHEDDNESVAKTIREHKHGEESRKKAGNHVVIADVPRGESNGGRIDPSRVRGMLDRATGKFTPNPKYDPHKGLRADPAPVAPAPAAVKTTAPPTAPAAAPPAAPPATAAPAVEATKAIPVVQKTPAAEPNPAADSDSLSAEYMAKHDKEGKKLEKKKQAEAAMVAATDALRNALASRPLDISPEFAGMGPEERKKNAKTADEKLMVAAGRAGEVINQGYLDDWAKVRERNTPPAPPKKPVTPQLPPAAKEPPTDEELGAKWTTAKIIPTEAGVVAVPQETARPRINDRPPEPAAPAPDSLSAPAPGVHPHVEKFAQAMMRKAKKDPGLGVDEAALAAHREYGAKMHALISDPVKLLEHAGKGGFDPHNPGSRQMFKDVTGKELPKGVNATREFIRQHATPPAATPAGPSESDKAMALEHLRAMTDEQRREFAKKIGLKPADLAIGNVERAFAPAAPAAPAAVPPIPPPAAASPDDDIPMGIPLEPTPAAPVPPPPPPPPKPQPRPEDYYEKAKDLLRAGREMDASNLLRQVAAHFKIDMAIMKPTAMRLLREVKAEQAAKA